MHGCSNVAHQALCSWGFSRQEYWNGLPCSPSRDLPHLGIEPRFPVLQPDSFPSEPPRKPKNTGVGSLSLLQGALPDPEIKLRSPALQVDSLPAEPPGKRKNTAVAAYPFFRGIFLTQKMNQGLLHCRWFLYQLSNQGSPQNTQWTCKCKCVMPGSSPGGSREFKEGTESAS